jgi:arginyl-tRNA--protein-N-Asp/Glu arginylyltransferase
MINSDYLCGFINKKISAIMSSGKNWRGKLTKVGTNTFVLTISSSYAGYDPDQIHLSLEHLESFLEIEVAKIN